MAKVKMTPSEAIVETLVAEGIDHVTEMVGSAFIDILDLFPAAGIRFVPVRHQQSAAHMEDAFGRVTGKAGIIDRPERARHQQHGHERRSGQHDSHAHDRVITLRGHRHHRLGRVSGGGPGLHLRVHNEGHRAGNTSSRAASALRTAFRIAYAERGPVLYDIPRDYFYGEIDEEILEPRRSAPTRRPPVRPNPWTARRSCSLARKTP